MYASAGLGPGGGAQGRNPGLRVVITGDLPPYLTLELRVRLFLGHAGNPHSHAVFGDRAS